MKTIAGFERGEESTARVVLTAVDSDMYFDDT